MPTVKPTPPQPPASVIATTGQHPIDRLASTGTFSKKDGGKQGGDEGLELKGTLPGEVGGRGGVCLCGRVGRLEEFKLHRFVWLYMRRGKAVV